MKNAVLYTFVALGLALPSIASAMTAEQSVHTDKARAIFMLLADESKEDE